MKHVTMAEKSLLIGDDAADTLLRYAALIARLGSGDAVTLRAIGVDGEDVTVSFLLNSGTVILAESTFSNLPEPDNSEQIEYMKSRIAGFEGPGSQPLQSERPHDSGE
jgi:hypothetical protein